jgi:hypothetical protein
VKIPPFPDCLRRARVAAGYPTKQALIDHLGMRRTDYSRLENGYRPNPAWNHVYSLIVGGNLPIEKFFPKKMIMDAARRLEPNGED